jgi:hypothetical protein
MCYSKPKRSVYMCSELPGTTLHDIWTWESSGRMLHNTNTNTKPNNQQAPAQFNQGTTQRHLACRRASGLTNICNHRQPYLLCICTSQTCHASAPTTASGRVSVARTTQAEVHLTQTLRIETKPRQIVPKQCSHQFAVPKQPERRIGYWGCPLESF